MTRRLRGSPEVSGGGSGGGSGSTAGAGPTTLARRLPVSEVVHE
jgi:hypothetical protein